MINAKYYLLPLTPRGTWGVEVDGKISPGDKVSVARPDGTTHIHTIAEICYKYDAIRLCLVVPVTSERLHEVFI